MMGRIPLIRHLLFVVFLLWRAIFCVSVSAQERTPAHPLPDSTEQVFLRHAFHLLETTYDINIVFEEGLIRGRKAIANFRPSGRLKKDLARLVQPYALTFEKVGTRTYVIIRRAETEPPCIIGTVVDEQGSPLWNANIYLAGTGLGTTSGENGRFVLKRIPPGSYLLTAEFVGYKPYQRTIRLSSRDSLSLAIELQRDILNFEAIVVTGIQSPRTKLESSIAVTTVNLQEIVTRAPQNTADLLKAIPGFYVESSGGEGGNNLFARGMPSDGSYRYVSLQEDGLPVFENSELMFANADIFLRVDESIRTLEGVRGGTGSIYASNAPGGIINFISKTGGESLAGTVRLTVGDYNLYRTDFNFGGPLGTNWRFNAGGFYRYDEGIRRPGFPANKGGQLKLNLTRLLPAGYIRFHGKLLNDSNIFYQPIPLQDKSNPRGIPGFDPNYGTLTSADANTISLVLPNGRYFEESLDEGMHPELIAFGGEAALGDDGNWSFRNSFRYTQIKQKFNAIFSLSDPFFIDTFADSIAGITNWQYRYAGTGEVIDDPLNLNDNGLVAEVGWWSVTMPMSNFANNAQLSKTFANHAATIGLYYSTYSVRPFWFWQNLLVEVADQPRPLDLIDLDSGVAFTKDGFTRYGSFFSNFQMDGLVNALYATDEVRLSERLRLDGGIRYETGTFKGQVENLYSENRYSSTGELIVDEQGEAVAFGYDLGDPTTRADDDVIFGDGTFTPFTYRYAELAFSLGAHVALDSATALYFRGSRGFRTPDDQHFVFFAPGSYKIERVLQFEGGLKYSAANFALFSSFFLSTFHNLPFSDEVVDPETGDIVRAFRFADSRTIGFELEAIFRRNNFSMDVTATLQNPVYLNYEFVGRDEDYSGNQVRRIPKMFFNMLMSYKLGRVGLHTTVNYYGRRFTDDANTGVLPAYFLMNARVSLPMGKIALALNATNLFNTIGLTEGNPRVDNTLDPRNYFFMARPVLGRAVTASFVYNF